MRPKPGLGVCVMSNRGLIRNEIRLARTANHMVVHLRSLGLSRLACEWARGRDGHLWLARKFKADGRES
jgi:hypothetical protein